MCCQPACSPCACHYSGKELWVPANWWTVCDCVGVYVCMLPSEHFVDSALQCQWHIERVSVGVPWFPSCCVYSICLLPKNTLKSIIPLSLSLLPSFFLLSIYLSYLLLTSLDLLFQISTCVVVGWCACRQPALVSPSAGSRIEFLSQPSSQPSFCLKSQNTFFFWMDIFTVGIKKVNHTETNNKRRCKAGSNYFH